VTTEAPALLVLALMGTFAFALKRRADRVANGPAGHRRHRHPGHDHRARGGIVLDAAGLSLFTVTGAGKALQLGLGPAQAVILGAITAAGGGTLRDIMIRQIPIVLRSELYAIPALIGAAAIVVFTLLGLYGLVTADSAAVLCFAIRMVGVRFNLNAPMPRLPREPRPDDD
jgi:uncharacterized membrane protein YeiH